MTGEFTGYAVVDTETTGISPGYHNRIAEIAIIHVNTAGAVTDEWATLLNPGRDLGPQAIHGIRAAEVRHAPRFDQVAAEVAHRLRGRVLVAHNWPFDAMHLRAEFERCGVDTPLHPRAGLCTMRAAGVAMPWAHRSLAECCTAAGLPDRNWHAARDDALAAADLFAHLLDRYPHSVRVTEEHLDLARWSWPTLPWQPVSPVHRIPVGHVEPHFLARLVERMPRDEEPEVDAYFAMLDDALLDRQISATEADALVELAYQLGLHKAEVLNVHHTYLRELARAAWVDGVVTEQERKDLSMVATLLGLSDTTVTQVLAEERTTSTTEIHSVVRANVGGLTLRPGDKVVLTGTMRRPRTEIAEQATAAGLRVTSTVSRKTRVVAAADPDSMSRKARNARACGVPVVSEDAFLRALDTMAD